jgi:hypothetical protein
MIRFRMAVLVGVSVAMIYAGKSLLAQPRATDACCTTNGDCGSGMKCCPYGEVGMSPCNGSQSGWCMASCNVGGDRR